MTKKTELVDIHGKVKYIHAVTPGKYGDWTIVLYPDESALNYIRELQGAGLKNVLKKDDDGWFIQFRRETQRVFKGKVQAFAPPRVVKDGIPFDGHKIGWGSDVTARLEVRWVTPPNATKQVPAARWEGVRIDNLVEFDVDKTALTPEEKEAHKSLVAAPESEPW